MTRSMYDSTGIAAQVRRTNSECAYGEWIDIEDETIGADLAGVVVDEIVESDEDSGEVEHGGLTWLWRRTPAEILQATERLAALAAADRICRYDDAETLGAIDLSDEQSQAIHAAAQWPEGLLSLGDLRSICGDDSLGGAAADSVTVYVE